MRRTRRLATLALPLGVGCLLAPHLNAQRPAVQTLVWPAPPEVARVRYVGSLGSEADLGRTESFLGRLARALAGRPKEGVATIQRPLDVHVEHGELFYFTDGASSSLLVFDRRKKEARRLGGDVPGGLSKPMGIGGDGLGNVYVADQSARRIVVLDSAGHYVRTFGGTSVLLNPIDVAVDREADRYYVVDSYLHQVVVFDSAGNVTGRLGKHEGSLADKNAGVGAERDSVHGRLIESRDLVENRSSEPGEFRYPGFAAVGPDGTLYVSDQMNFRVQAFDRTGEFALAFGGIGDGPGSFARPKGVAVDDRGHIYVVDAAFNNVQVFDAEGRLLLAFGAIGHGEGQHWLPIGIAIDDDRIYVADRYNNRAQIYQFLDVGDPPDSPPQELPVDSRVGAR